MQICFLKPLLSPAFCSSLPSVLSSFLLLSLFFLFLSPRIPVESHIKYNCHLFCTFSWLLHCVDAPFPRQLLLSSKIACLWPCLDHRCCCLWFPSHLALIQLFSILSHMKVILNFNFLRQQPFLLCLVLSAQFLAQKSYHICMDSFWTEH